MFHYGIAGWSMYALLGMAMGYFAYRWGMPLSIRAALYPLLGKRVRGTTGDVIDIFALVGTVFGVATSMGIGVVLLNVGFSMLFGLPEGLALQIALVLVAVLMTVAACTSGVDKGIRLISELNLWSAGAMMLYILVTGKTAFLLNAMVENVGRFVFTLPERTLATFAYESDGSAWMASWTLFFWRSGLHGDHSSDCSWLGSPAVAPCASSSSPRSPPRCCATSSSSRSSATAR